MCKLERYLWVGKKSEWKVLTCEAKMRHRRCSIFRLVKQIIDRQARWGDPCRRDGTRWTWWLSDVFLPWARIYLAVGGWQRVRYHQADNIASPMLEHVVRESRWHFAGLKISSKPVPCYREQRDAMGEPSLLSNPLFSHHFSMSLFIHRFAHSRASWVAKYLDMALRWRVHYWRRGSCIFSLLSITPRNADSRASCVMEHLDTTLYGVAWRPCSF